MYHDMDHMTHTVFHNMLSPVHSINFDWLYCCYKPNPNRTINLPMAFHLHAIVKELNIIVEISPTICDWICEKESYTRIHFFNFAEV